MKKYPKILFSYLFCSQIYAGVLPIPEIDIGSIDPARVGRDLSSKPIEILSTAKQLDIPILTQSVELGDAKKYTFKLKKVSFIDNTVIGSEQLEAVYQRHYGKTITLAKLLELINETTLEYRNAGYILSQAYLPAQDIDKEAGIIKVGIVEGYVNEVNVSGASIPYSTKVLLRQYGERMKMERPITKATLERYALLAQDLPGGGVKTVFSPATNQSGAANLEFITDDSKLWGLSASVDNRGTRLLGPIELSATLDQFHAVYGNQTTANMVGDDGDELRITNFSHSQPLNSNGLKAFFQYVKTKTNPNYKDLPAEIRSDITTPGLGFNYTGQLSYPLIRSRTYNLMAQTKLDVSESVTKTFDIRIFDERLKMLRGGLTFDWLDSVFFENLGLTSIGFEFTQGLTGRWTYLKPEYATRPNLKKDFQKITGTVMRQQPLGAGFELKLLANGQYAYDELASSEEYGYGGKDIGLGYDSYEISGDHGIAGKLELNYTLPTEELIKFASFDAEVFGFYDAGKVWNKHPFESAQNPNDMAKSAGFGIRGSIMDYFTYEAYYAKPLARDLQNTLDTSSRVFFNFGVAYPP